ncbi:helix-turn-helix domain-containing protein [Bacillus sp. SCS-151]|uniref:helix-turn-helix domain-containing protein n=1 Tax=Nanhaiella sioensis TaxID=3115293 RepID=UPI00397C4701
MITIITYKPLWKLLIDLDMNKKQLREATGLSPTIISNMTKDQYVNIKTLETICLTLDCKIEDVVEIIKE